MKLFTRLATALSLTVLIAASAVAQVPTTMAPNTHVKGYTKVLKSGKTVKVKGYNRMAKMMSKTTAVKGYTKILKSGKTVSVKGYTRKTPMKGMKKPTM